MLHSLHLKKDRECDTQSMHFGGDRQTRALFFLLLCDHKFVLDKFYAQTSH